MKWILILTFIVILIQIIVIGICFSNMVLNIQECDLSYNEDNRKKFNIREFKISIQVYLFKVIKILNIKIYEDYCEIFKIKVHLNVLKKLKDDDEKGTIYVIKNIVKLQPEIKKVDLEITLGTEDTMITTFLIPTISTALSLLISKYMKEDNNSKNSITSNYNFKVTPKYINTNNFRLKGSVKISFDTLRTLFFIKKHREIKI